jgi:anti-sigma B factor antagonist
VFGAAVPGEIPFALRPVRIARSPAVQSPCARSVWLLKEWDMAAPVQRRLDIEEVGDVTVARFIDKKILDENNIQIIGNQLFGLVEEDGRKKIVLDFTNVEYLSSAALGKLITMDKKVKASGGKLRLCNIRKDIYEVFAITRLNKVFDIRNTQDEAVAGL